MSDRDCENCKHHTEKGCESWDCEFEQGMTRKEAIKRLKEVRSTIQPYRYVDEVLNMAINSLKIDEQYELEYENAEEIHREKEQAYMQGYEDACKKYRQEPKTGRWKKISPADIYECSECGQNVMTADICAYRYCHGCGAKMEESEGKE